MYILKKVSKECIKATVLWEYTTSKQAQITYLWGYKNKRETF